MGEYDTPVTPDDERILELVGQLSIDDKVLLLTGRDFWSTHPLASLGLRSIVLSDGPSGVRGPTWDERSPSLNLPSATALASTWDPSIAYDYGAASAAEARRKGVDVVLGPTINLHRSPLGGRHFESFSEDPRLTGDLAAAYVRGLQDNGVGATPKHYVANDSETDRFTVDVQVSERALRELYLLAFERAVSESRTWLVMSAYNSINGETATESSLLDTPLNTEWGFDGVVVSDWGAVRSVESARHPQDLVMPGPHGAWGQRLVDAVRDGDIDEAVIDRKVARLLALAARVGALDGFVAPPDPATVDGVALARRAEIEGSVLVRNQAALPVDPTKTTRVAVVGDNAIDARTQGGGSATVIPAAVVSPLDGLREAFGDDVVVFARGAVVHEGLSPFAAGTMHNPVTGEAGAHVRFLDADGGELFSEDRFASRLVYVGGDAPVEAMTTFEFTTEWTPESSGATKIGVAGVGAVKMYLDGELCLDEQVSPADGSDPATAILNPPAVTTTVDVTEGRAIAIRVEFVPATDDSGVSAMSVAVGTEPAHVDGDALIAEAVAVATDADVAIVVVGTNAATESEGFDRVDLALPGRQDELVRAVAAVNSRTVVVVNSGAPVELPWRDEVAAVLVTYFGGQEYGHALADIITGVAEPGGRLPTTWPATITDVPVLNTTPTNGVLAYDEGIHIGYRAWLKAGATPAYPFGAGFGYTTWDIGEPTIVGHQDHASIEMSVTNIGHRHGKTVVQVYASLPTSTVDRPVRWLVGFSVLRAEPGASLTAIVQVPYRALAYWDGRWVLEPGEYQLHVGTSVVDLPHTVTATLV